MFRKFRESPYSKMAITALITGALLILFKSWVDNAQFSVGFETLGRTLTPIIIGIVCAFILCPIYNGCVKRIYNWQISNAKNGGFSFGQKVVPASGDEFKVDASDKRRMLKFAKAISSLIAVVIVVGLIAMLIYFVVPQVIQNVITLVNTLPERVSTLSAWIDEHFGKYPTVTKWIDSIANAGTSGIISWINEHLLSGNAANIATTISNGLYAAVSYIVNAVLGLLIMVYLLNYKDSLFAILRKITAAIFSQKKQAGLYEFAEIVNETFIGFIVGRIIDSFIIGVLTFFVLTVFNIQFALMISVIVGVTNVIPFFGPFIGAVPSVLILMLEEPMQALYFIIIILVIQQIDGNIIGPNVVGNAIGISSFGVLLAVLVGGGLFGFAGMALGVPVFAVIARYVDKLSSKSLKNKDKPTSTQDYFNLKVYGIEDPEVVHEADKKKESFLNRNKRNKLQTSAEIPGDEENEYDEAAEKAELRAFLEKEREENKSKRKNTDNEK